jgi:hypothetical protein
MAILVRTNMNQLKGPLGLMTNNGYLGQCNLVANICLEECNPTFSSTCKSGKYQLFINSVAVRGPKILNFTRHLKIICNDFIKRNILCVLESLGNEHFFGRWLGLCKQNINY